MIVFLVILVLFSGPMSPLGFAAERLQIYTENVEPAQYVDEKGNLTGVSVEIVRELQRRVGDTSPIRIALWANAYREVQTRSHTALFSMMRTPERENLFQWVGPILRHRSILVARGDSPVILRTLEDAKKLGRIGTVRADYRDQILRAKGFANLDPIDYSDQNVRRLMAGRIDAFVISDVALPHALKKMGYRRTDVRELLSFDERSAYIAFSRGTPSAVVERWRTACAEMTRDGTLSRIHRKWHVGKTDPVGP